MVRGFESFTESLFQSLRRYAPAVDVTLFQAGGWNRCRCKSIPSFHRQDAPARWFGHHKASLLEERSFALCLYPHLRAGGYDIVHYNELCMGSALFHLRRFLGGRFRLLYCNGGPAPPELYHHRCDIAQMLTGPMYEQARSFGITEERLLLVPYGVDAERFSPQSLASRVSVRNELGIPPDAPMVLCVAAIKREHKRIDYLIEEVARLDTKVWLVVAGQVTNETDGLRALAVRELGQRWRFVSWPYDRMHLLYGAADVFVLSSLTEGFGLVVIEALASGLPAVLHDEPTFRWVVGGTDSQLVDMTVPGALTGKLEEVLSSPCKARADARASVIRDRFGWEKLVSPYIRMYRKAVGAVG